MADAVEKGMQQSREVVWPFVGANKKRQNNSNCAKTSTTAISARSILSSIKIIDKSSTTAVGLRVQSLNLKAIVCRYHVGTYYL
jgi:hypothetical protein